MGELCLLQGEYHRSMGEGWGGLMMDLGDVVLCEAECPSANPPPGAVTWDMPGDAAVPEEPVPRRSAPPPTIGAPMNQPQHGALHGDQDIGGLMYRNTSSVLSGV